MHCGEVDEKSTDIFDSENPNSTETCYHIDKTVYVATS